jgi:hypothetical protein
MNPGEISAEIMPVPYATETNRPTSSPGTCNDAATAGAMAGSENSAIVASVCAASVAISGQSGTRRGYSRSSRVAFPLAILARSSAQSGIVGSQSVPGLLATNG